MARIWSLEALLATVIVLLARADHPCTPEVASACPERPGDEIAACLKDPSSHDSSTEISSECTDFMALNSACKEDIGKFCDGAAFSDDTTLCLTTWAEPEDLSPKCSSVMKWAIPKADDEEATVTDELGMSQEDHDEKEAWRAKRKAGRQDAIARMNMKEVDRKKEEDRVALEKLKTENPEEYASMMEQQAESKRQEAEFKRKERQIAAALERKRKIAAGETEEDSGEAKQKKGAKAKQGGSAKKDESSPLTAAAALLFVVLVCVGAYYLVSGAGKAGAASKKTKKKRG